MLPGDIVVDRLILRSSDEFVEVEFGGSGPCGFCVLGVEFDGLGAFGRGVP